MSKPIKFSWPIADLQAVCINQTRPAAGNLIINGTLSTNPHLPPVRAEFPKICRQILIQSAGNLSGVQFSISGIGENGYPKTVQIAGPNNNIVNTGTDFFSTVHSVYVNGPVATNVRVGTGTEGATMWYLSDHYRSFFSLAVNVKVTGTITYSFQTTYDDPSENDDCVILEPIDGSSIATIPTGSDMKDSQTDCLVNYTIPTRYSRILVSNSDATGALDISFLEQG